MQHLPDEAIGAGAEGSRRIDPEESEQVLDLSADTLGDGGQDKVVAPELVKAHLLRRKERVPGAGENGQRLGPKGLALEAVRRRRLIQTPHDHVEFARGEQRQQLLRAPLLQTHPDSGVVGLEPGESAGQHPGRGDRQGAECYGAPSGAGLQVEVFVKPAQLGEDAPGGPHEHRTHLGRTHAAGMAVEQPELEDVLQLVQALGQGRLADAEGHGRLEQAPVRFDGVHGPQQVKAKALVKVAAGRHPSAPSLNWTKRSLVRSIRSSRSRRPISSIAALNAPMASANVPDPNGACRPSRACHAALRAPFPAAAHRSRKVLGTPAIGPGLAASSPGCPFIGLRPSGAVQADGDLGV